ncbi:MAG TPA: amino acid permease [Vicinamibacterales bacterium]|nr:amino acid permease [Vicinamibacterales bacterium]
MTTNPTQSLERRLGPLDAAAIIVSNVIGTGLLFAPSQVAAAVPSALPFLAAWLVGGVLAFAGAMAYAELAALRPRAGGEYVYLKEAFGPQAAFLTGWTSFVAGFSGAIATSAMVLAFYLGRFVPAAGNSTPFFTLPIVPGTLELSLSPQTTVAIAAIVGMSWIHLRGVGPGRLVMDVLATLKVGAFVLFIALGFSFGTGTAANLGQPGSATATGWLLALIPVMFAYSGWNAATYVAEEIRNPGRNVPRALALGTVAVVLVHVLMNALYLYVMPVGDLGRVQGSVLDFVAEGLLGSGAGNIMGVVSIVSLLASISAMTFAGPRVYFAMARDGLFFRRAADVHRGYKTPAAAIIAQALWSSLLVLSAKADALLTYTGFAIVLFSGVAVVSLFVLRARQPQAERPFRAWGYPIAPGVFAVASAAILINGLVRDPGPTGAGALIILAGIPLYFFFRKRGG